ncbi:Undecaprenyl-diphosphatase BcrC [Caprobacter fermentans]|uniref:Phosphatase PAP2 family protein n=1 Tax=Caproicibacter fermentans TaxID=2576756 RepID=A0A6N8HVZ7_9FIRM|nr:phosphatase PAP2 family protein [Caproicibacter fermentans]MVB09902.1 Undecaprenyl-diphosphatase BcrC [Caproicibacter fermentans]OCN00316.1 hypothetical protein A7X67_09670 [Clostridium sp. W14A]QNK42141.1 phosphatase PAP2 family protein [Caproicibacter fermentans]
MDTKVIEYVQLHCHNRITDFIFPLISRIGNAGAVWLIYAAVWMLEGKSRRFVYILIFSLALSHLTGQLLKLLVGRPRPFAADHDSSLLIKAPGGYSFPSGHSSSSFAAATVFFLLNSPLCAAAIILAFLIAFSRIFLNVHYPSDTLAGSLLGVLCAILVSSAYGL